MSTTQAKSHSPNKVATKTAETPQKATVSAASATRVPAWANGMGHQLPAGLVLQNASTIPSIQAKLTINQPNDPYEQEADRVADHVMRIPASPTLVQRKCACGGIAGPTGECEECAAKRKTLQRRATQQAPESTAPPIVNQVLSSGNSQPLDAGTRAFMEPHFGTDFSQVRVHTDTKAAESARSVNALAYTVGSDVVFGKGQYQPGTGEGQRLLAHELTHVVQQGYPSKESLLQRDYIPSNMRHSFEQAVAAKDWKNAFLNLNGLNMFEMLRAIDTMMASDRDLMWKEKDKYKDLVNLPRIQYAWQVVINHFLLTPIGDLEATGQVQDARNFLAEKTKDKGTCLPEKEANTQELAAANATLTKSRTIADTIITSKSPSDLAYWFAELYYYITLYEIQEKGVFSYPAFIMHFIPIFYDMYAENAVHFSKQELDKIAANWQEHFATASARLDPSMLYPYINSATNSLISGVKAHIQGDMPVALENAYRTYTAKYCNKLPFDSYHPDFFERNKPIFTKVRSSLINELINRGLMLQLPGRGGIDPELASKVADMLKIGLNIDDVYSWRESAWQTAKKNLGQ